MGECRECRWWDQAELGAMLGWGRLPIPMTLLVGLCCRANRDDAPMKILNTSARLNDDGTLRSRVYLVTQGIFGCNQFAPREGTVSDGSPD